MTEAKLDEVIKRYTDNAEYVRQRGDLEGCMEFRELAEFLAECKKSFIACEDCVSREAVINAIYDNSVRENEYNLTASRIKKAVEALPPVTPKQKWIPIGERYPTKQGWYQVTVIDPRDMFYNPITLTKFWGNDVKYSIEVWQGCGVTAWMPLPKPYCGAESEDKK